jgi:hypothetical protein
VARYYKRGGNKNDHIDPLLEPIDLSDDDIAALVAFLQALSRPAEAPPAESAEPAETVKPNAEQVKPDPESKPSKKRVY